jgi:glycerol-3-phosphate O-acyltransferase
MATKVFPPVIPDLANWPIFKLSEDRAKFIAEIDEFTFQHLTSTYSSDAIRDMIQQTIYSEKTRIKNEPWKVDPPNDMQFFNQISKDLVRKGLDNKDLESSKETYELLLKKLIHRYSEEIVGTFKISTFLFARKFLTAFFGRLLNAASAKSIFKLLTGGKLQIADRFKIEGDVAQIQALMKQGTVIMLPTHFSNLDSILVGYVMDSVLGLPQFSYGAGLNLYNNGLAAYFINRLGAYRVDRRKKNDIYLETLKAMSNLSIQRGTNSLFFPGGTRSRSGALETRLKMGLLGTVVEAQRAKAAKDPNDKIFVVPLVMSYHFVLEGQFLVDSHLKSVGKERYFKLGKDEFYSFRKTIQYVWKFFSEDSEITLSFGKPLDVMGNFVDQQGKSFDNFGNEINISEYFLTEGVVSKDLQRETEYTRLLADKLVERYHQENVVLSSHFVAFVAFNLLKSYNPKMDLYAVLRLQPDDYIFPKDSFVGAAAQLQQKLQALAADNKIKLSEQMNLPINELVKHGVSELGIYHLNTPLQYTKEGDIVSSNFNLLYFYNNRLENYSLDKKVAWQNYPLKMA